MKLRAKFTLTIAVAFVVPIVGATLVGRELVQRESQLEFERSLSDGEVEVNVRYHAFQEEVTQAVERLADPEDQFVRVILDSLSSGNPDGLDDAAFRPLVTRVMEERGLDVLLVLDPLRGGKILASGHFPGWIGETYPHYEKTALSSSVREVILTLEKVMVEGRSQDRLVAETWRRARSFLGAQVVVMGGRLLIPEFVRRLRLRQGTEVLVKDASGKILAGPQDWMTKLAHSKQRVIALKDQKGKVAASITLAVSDQGLRSALRAINDTALALLLSGLGLSLVLGFFGSRPIGRRLQELVRGAEAVAKGDLEKQLPVGSQDEVGELVEAFNHMTSELKDSKEKLVAAERLAAWREIARRIAHEIKNPLFPIQTSIETMRKVYAKKHPSFEEIFNESTTMILEEVERLKNIVTEFSQFARLPKPKLAPCDLRELIPQVISLYGGEEIPILCELPEDLPSVMGDREQLTQVVVNLIKNSREALIGARPADASPPRIVISALVQGEWVEVRVEDNGPGFDEKVGAEIFTPYFTTKGESGGTGLGLAIVHRIVTDHGGRIEARSQVGQGTTFLIRLPLVYDSEARAVMRLRCADEIKMR